MLHEACRSGTLADVRTALAQAGTSINSYCNGETALYIAASRGDTDICRLLVQAGADTEEGHVENGVDNLSGATPLVAAAIQGWCDTVQYLLSIGAHKNVTYRRGKNALTSACQLGHGDVVKVLLEAGCNVDHQEADGWSPLLIACLKGHEDIAR